MPIAKSVEDTVLGEALAGDYQDILGVVSVIDNRARQTKTTYDDVVSAKGQFDAYGKPMPAGVSKYRGLVDKAIAEVREKGPVHQATFYATPAAVKGLPKGLAYETKTAGHQYYSDPQGRSIATAKGYKTPDPTAQAAPQGLTNVAGDPSGTLYDVAEATATAGPTAAPAATSVASEPFDAVLGRTTSTPSLTGTTAFGFPTYAPTVDLEDRALSPVRGVQDYNPGAQRSLNPTTGVIEATQQAVTRSFGPGYTVGVFSGQEPRGLAAVGSKANHPGGYAIDFDVIDPMGNPVDVKDPQAAAAMRGVHTSLAATGRGIGYGVGYMTRPDGTMGRTHVGTPPGSSVVGWGRTGKAASMDPSLYSELSQAKATGVSLPSIGPTPTDPTVSRSPLGMPAASITGTIGMPSVGPTFAAPAAQGTTYGPAGQTPAGFAELGPIGTTSRAGIAAPAPESILGPISMPTQQPYFAPTAPRSVPTPTPNPMFTPPAVPARVAPVAPQQAAPQQTGMPSAPMPSAADVWGGRAQVGRATNGNVVSRNPDGSVSMTSSKYGYTEVDGQYRGKVDPSTVGRVGGVGVPGPLGRAGGIAAPVGQAFSRGISQATQGLSQTAKGRAGAVAGGLLGGMFGPAGGIVGAMIGRNLARGKSVTGKSVDSFGWGLPTATQARSAYAQGFTPGLGFPTAPIGNASQGGLTDFGKEAARGDHGGQAQSAANSPGRGLY